MLNKFNNNSNKIIKKHIANMFNNFEKCIKLINVFLYFF